jgi:DNA mismatch repair ATPase MutS
VAASLRVQDSLQAGESRFLAEIRRLRQMVDLTRGSVPVLFLIDEILQGTNPADRHAGAEAVLLGLLNAGALGLVTTHDLPLTELAARPDAPLTNVHFADRIENGRPHFDYRMRPGVVPHSNALALMRLIGL